MPEDANVSAEPVTVVVADDQSAVREGLVLLLGTLPGISVAGEAADGNAAVLLVAEVRPQVVLMDLNMPGCDGVTATRSITASYPDTQVVVLTTYADDDSIIGALQAGALGYLTKDATRAEIGRAVLAAAAGQSVLDPVVRQKLLSRAAGGPPPAASATDENDLTPREAEVLRLIAAGQSNREIGKSLFVSEATVKTHVNRIFAKTGSRDRGQAIHYAYTHGYASSLSAPVRGQQAQDDLVRELPVYPAGPAQCPLEHEPGALGRADHAGVVGKRVHLEPLETEDLEAVVAQGPDHVGTQALAAEGRPQVEPEMSHPVVLVNAPQRADTGQFSAGQFDHGKRGGLFAAGTDPVRFIFRTGRYRTPRIPRSPVPRRDVRIELRLEHRYVAFLTGPQPDLFASQHALLLPHHYYYYRTITTAPRRYYRTATVMISRLASVIGPLSQSPYWSLMLNPAPARNPARASAPRNRMVPSPTWGSSHHWPAVVSDVFTTSPVTSRIL
jgi:DNA-binding NarL/FixJ family response regulator